MNRFPLIFAGMFAAVGSAWVGLVMLPYLNLGQLRPASDADTGAEYPPPLSGEAHRGRRVYAANGCIYCHSQQIRGRATARLDLERGWGPRRTVARDYLRERPVMLGTMRTGPDLTNIGQRQRDRAWHYRNLYDPRGVYPHSIMPAFRHLFDLRQIVGEHPADAVALSGPHAPPAGSVIVPKPEAADLVAYLLSLDRTYPLEEAAEEPAP